jgi:hypothetical protein
MKNKAHQEHDGFSNGRTARVDNELECRSAARRSADLFLGHHVSLLATNDT